MLTLAIQAGGQSSRMGEDKALKPFLGRPLIRRVIDRLTPIADEILITTNHPEDYRFLGLPLFEDLHPGRGALGGLYTAIHSAGFPIVAVAACDLPFANPALFEYAALLLTREEVDVVIPESGEGLEPLHAVYRRSTCLPAIETALQADRFKVISWFPEVKVRILSPSEVYPLDKEGRAFWNLNTPEEFTQAEQLCRQTDQQRDGHP